MMRRRSLVIIAAGAAHKDAALAPGQNARVVSGVLDAVPAGLQEHALLRIHVLRFCRRDVEKERIKQIVFVECSEILAVCLACRGLAGLVVGIHIPSLARHLRNAISPLGEVPPELVDVLCSWKLAGHTDDRNRLWPTGCRRAADAGEPRCRAAAAGR